MVPKVVKGRKVNKDTREIKGQQAILALWVQQAPQARKVISVLPVRLAALVLSVRLALRVIPVYKETPVIQVIQVLLAKQATLDLLDRQVRREIPVYKAIPVPNL